MPFDNPVAITKHPKGTGTFCIRLCTEGGSRYQNHLAEPKSIVDMLAILEEQAAWIRQHFTSSVQRAAASE